MILNDLLNKYADKRSHAVMKAEQNFRSALDNAEFFAAEKKCRELNMQYGKDGTQELSQKLQLAQANRSSILTDLGLNLEPVFECESCRDTGYSDGKLCKCIKKELSNQIARICGISQIIKCDFDSCDLSIFSELKQQKNMEMNYKKMKQYCDKFPSDNINTIVFSGETGTGKTYLISIIANELSCKGFDVFFTTAFGLNNIFLKSHTAPIEEKNQYIAPLIDCDLLIIDDLGTEPIYRNVSIEYLYAIINERKTKQKQTLISTNLVLDKILNRYGERFFSRLNNKVDSLFLSFAGKDIRLGNILKNLPKE